MAADPSRGRASQLERHAEAAGDLYERYSGQVFGYCFHQLGSREEAEDAVQTTFMNAFRGLSRGIDPKAESAWVFKIAHNVCLSRRRSSWRRRRVESPNDLEVLQEVVPAKEKVADELLSLQPALEAMPETQRRAILLREWQGLSYREIADELNLSQGAVETLIFRARRALATGLEETPARSVWRRRLRRGADVGGVLAFVKAMLGGGGTAAVKVATAAALTGAAVATTAADRMLPLHRPPAKAPVGVAPRQAPETAKTVPRQTVGLVDVPRLRNAPGEPARVMKAHKPPRRHAVVPPTSGTAQPAPAPGAPVRGTPEPVPPETTPPLVQTNQGTTPTPQGNDPKTPLGTQARPSDSPPPPGTPDTPPQVNEKQPLPDGGPVTQPPSAPGG